MNCWRRYRLPKIGLPRIGVAALALLSLCGSPVARSQDLSPPAATSTAIVMACALCGTRWQAHALTAPSAPSMDFTKKRPESGTAGNTARPNAQVTPGLDAFRDLSFRDNEPLVNRLKRIQAVAFVTVWDSTSATLYVGVNRDGEPGLHLRQKKYDRGTLAPVKRTLFSDITPWRAAMLASQPRLR